MVDTLLIIVASITLLGWMIHEICIHFQIKRHFNHPIGNHQPSSVGQWMNIIHPTWSSWVLRGILMLWLVWLIIVLLVKDGDFAWILVILTLLAGIMSGLDRWVFAPRRLAYSQSSSSALYLASYEKEDKDTIIHAVNQASSVVDYAKSFFPVLLIVLILRSFVVEPFQIPSSSMYPTLEVGDYILVNKFNYALRLPVLGTQIVEFKKPTRGDVIVFFPPNDKRYFIKRVVGLPGDHISYTNKVLKINGSIVEQEVLLALPPLQPVVEIAQEQLGNVQHLIQKDMRVYGNDFSLIVEPGHYFMMGDNRDNSSDSRVWGVVPEKNIVGQAFAIWMHWGAFYELPSFDRIGTIH